MSSGHRSHLVGHGGVGGVGGAVELLGDLCGTFVELRRVDRWNFLVTFGTLHKFTAFLFTFTLFIHSFSQRRYYSDRSDRSDHSDRSDRSVFLPLTPGSMAEKTTPVARPQKCCEYQFYSCEEQKRCELMQCPKSDQEVPSANPPKFHKSSTQVAQKFHSHQSPFGSSKNLSYRKMGEGGYMQSAPRISSHQPHRFSSK